MRRARRASRRRALAVRCWQQGQTRCFGVRVPVRAHTLADPEKGSGIAMICTFGDTTDVTWWRELSLPVRAIIQPDGTLGPVVGRRAGESADACARQPVRMTRSCGCPQRKRSLSSSSSFASRAIWSASRGRSRTP